MEKTIKHTDNGIMVVTHRLPHLHSVTVSVNFKVGSLYENDLNRGITHLIEHLFFRQLNDLPQKQLYLEMQRMGAEIIGSTYYDFVSFKMTVVPRYFIRSLKLLLKLLEDFSWTESKINSEKLVVAEQINNNAHYFDDLCNELYFKGTQYEYPIMGDIDSLYSISAKAVNDWKAKYFNSRNACIVIVGNYSDAELTLAESLISAVKSFGNSSSLACELPVNFCKRSLESSIKVIDNDCDYTNLTAFFDVSSDCDYETARLLMSILGDGCGSMLSMRLREDNALTDDVYTDLMCYKGFSRLSISYTAGNDNLFESIRLLFHTIGDIKRSISDEAYQSSIVFFTDNQLMDLDNSKRLNSTYALCDFVLNSIISAPYKKIEKYKSITVGDLVDCANKIFIPENLSLVLETSFNGEGIRSFIKNLRY